jgi:hypothetical protein
MMAMAVSASASAVAAQQPQSLWHYDPADGDTVFSMPGWMARDPYHGRVFLTDAMERRVFVLDGATGRLLRTIGREGDGPGEFRFIGLVALSPDGKLLAVHDQVRQSVDLFNQEFRPIERRNVGMMYSPKSLAVLNDSTVVLSGGHMPFKQLLSSVTWADDESVTFNGPLPPEGKNPGDINQMVGRANVAGGVLAQGRDGLLLAEAATGDVWLITRTGKARLAAGPGGVTDVAEKYMRPITLKDGKPGFSPWTRFPQAIYLEEEAPNTFLEGWSQADDTLFTFYRLRPGAAPERLLDLHERIFGLVRYDASSFILLEDPAPGTYRLERREIRLSRVTRAP